MKIIKKILSVIVISFFFLSLVSCGFVDSSSGGKSIKSIESIVENGQTKLVITYEDEDIKPDVFVLPVGKEGVGIKTIVVNDKLDGTGKTLSIYLTDGSEPEVFELTNGISVVGTESEIDKETGNTLVYIKYSDGSKSEPIEILKGENGNGFTNYKIEQNEDGSQTVILEFGEEKAEILIPAPLRGPEGRGIQAITSFVKDDKYVFYIEYNDGTVEEVYFDKPADPSTWLSGQAPSNREGKDGDFFFDTEALKIYRKEKGKWVEVADLGVDKGTCTVRFELNSPKDAKAQMPSGSQKEYTVGKYTYFTDPDNGHGSIPIPTCPGYIFKGWYTKFGNDINETTGKFTDLTPILSDLTLFAKWEKEI